MQIKKKVCLLGDFAVGKTSLIRRFVEGQFDDKYLSTIGVKISRKTISYDSNTLELIVWDLAGGDDFSKMGANYLRGASGALIVCDLTRPSTINALTYYTNQLRTFNPEVALVFAGNKVDLTAERAIKDEDLKNLADALGGPCLLTSAKTGECVEDAFHLLANQIGLD